MGVWGGMQDEDTIRRGMGTHGDDTQLVPSELGFLHNFVFIYFPVIE
jgi:hypothetical protein